MLACSTELQQLWRVELEEREEKRTREPHDVQVVALDPLDEPSAEPLDRVPAGAALPLPALEVRRQELSR